MSLATDQRPSPANAAAPATPNRVRRRAAALEHLGTVYVLFESFRQVSRFTAHRRSGTPVTAAFLMLPVARGLAGLRLLAGHPGRAERAVLEALIAGLGTVIPACQSLAEAPEKSGNSPAVPCSEPDVPTRMPA